MGVVCYLCPYLLAYVGIVDHSLCNGDGGGEGGGGGVRRMETARMTIKP